MGWTLGFIYPCIWTLDKHTCAKGLSPPSSQDTGSWNSRDKIQGWNPSVTWGKRGGRVRKQEGRVMKQNTQGRWEKKWNSHIMKGIAGLSSIVSRGRTGLCWCLDPYCPVSCWPAVGTWLMDNSVTTYGRRVVTLILGSFSPAPHMDLSTTHTPKIKENTLPWYSACSLRTISPYGTNHYHSR